MRLFVMIACVVRFALIERRRTASLGIRPTLDNLVNLVDCDTSDRLEPSAVTPSFASNLRKPRQKFCGVLLNLNALARIARMTGDVLAVSSPIGATSL